MESECVYFETLTDEIVFATRESFRSVMEGSEVVDLVSRLQTDGQGHWSTITGDPVSSLEGCIIEKL